MDMFPDITVHATRRLLRLLYIQQLSRAFVSPFVPPADTTDIPIVVIVGHEAVGKGTLVRRLTSECSNIELARQHTTAIHHFSDHFIEITRQKFDNMLLTGDLLTYSELAGESYGLSREEAFTKNGKVKIVNMDLVGALMLKLRGYHPYLILATMRDTQELVKKQLKRRTLKENYCSTKRTSVQVPYEQETLQVLLSGRIIITGILNEIIMELPEEKECSDFLLESECSLMMDSEVRKVMTDYIKDPNVIALLNSSNFSLSEVNRRHREKTNNDEQSLYSLFKDSQVDYSSYLTNGLGSYQKLDRRSKVKYSNVSFGRYTTSSFKVPNERSKSVTFDKNSAINSSGMFIEAPTDNVSDEKLRSISTKAPWPAPGQHAQHGPQIDVNDSDLWLAFLTEAGQRQASEISEDASNIAAQRSRIEDHTFMMNEIRNQTIPTETVENLESMETLSKAHLREDYESIHRRNPGLFWDTVTTDDPDAAFKKVKRIIRDIVSKQRTLKPMFDIDFANVSCYPTVEQKLLSIRKQIAPHQLFF